jgi:type IV pilus assembly protein PilV
MMRLTMTRQTSPKSQAGIALLESLIAILIIAFGVLGIIGLQANSIGFVSDARYRVDAAAAADRLLAEMWVNPLNLASYAWDGSGPPPAVLTTAPVGGGVDWLSSVGNLPGASSPGKRPIIEIGADNLVKITIRWSPPNAEGVVHQHVIMANIIQDPEN